MSSTTKESANSEYFLLKTHPRKSWKGLKKVKESVFKPPTPECFKYAGLKFVADEIDGEMVSFRLVSCREDESIPFINDYRISSDFMDGKFHYLIEFLDNLGAVVYSQTVLSGTPFFTSEEDFNGLSAEEKEAAKAPLNFTVKGMEIWYEDKAGKGFYSMMHAGEDLVPSSKSMKDPRDVIQYIIFKLFKCFPADEAEKPAPEPYESEEEEYKQDLEGQEDRMRTMEASEISYALFGTLSMHVVTFIAAKYPKCVYSLMQGGVGDRRPQVRDCFQNYLTLYEFLVRPLIKVLEGEIQKETFEWNPRSQPETSEFWGEGVGAEEGSSEDERDEDQERPAFLAPEPTPPGYDQLSDKQKVLRDLEDWYAKVKAVLERPDFDSLDMRQALNFRCPMDGIFYSLKKVIFTALELPGVKKELEKTITPVVLYQKERDKERAQIKKTPGYKGLTFRNGRNPYVETVFPFVHKALEKEHSKIIGMNVFDRRPKCYNSPHYKRNFGRYTLEIEEEGKMVWSFSKTPEKTQELGLGPANKVSCLTDRAFYTFCQCSEDTSKVIVDRYDFSGLASGQPPVLQAAYFEINTASAGGLARQLAEGTKMLAFPGDLDGNRKTPGFFVVFKEDQGRGRVVQRVVLDDYFKLVSRDISPILITTAAVKEVQFNYDKVRQISVWNDRLNIAFTPYQKEEPQTVNTVTITACCLHITRGVEKPRLLASGSYDMPFESRGMHLRIPILALAGRAGLPYFLVFRPNSEYLVLRLKRSKLLCTSTGKGLTHIEPTASTSVHVVMDRVKKLLAVSESVSDNNRFAAKKKDSVNVAIFKFRY